MSINIDQEKQNKSVDAIIQRLKTALNVSTDSELAVKFGYRRQAVSEWRKRQVIPLRTVFAKCGHIREDWLLSGDGPIMKGDKGAEALLLSNEKIGDLMRQIVQEVIRSEGLQEK